MAAMGNAAAGANGRVRAQDDAPALPIVKDDTDGDGNLQDGRSGRMEEVPAGIANGR